MKYLKTFESFHNDHTQFTLNQLKNENEPESNVKKEDLDQLMKKDINKLTQLDDKKPVKQMIKRFRKKKQKKEPKFALPTN